MTNGPSGHNQFPSQEPERDPFSDLSAGPGLLEPEQVQQAVNRLKVTRPQAEIHDQLMQISRRICATDLTPDQLLAYAAVFAGTRETSLAALLRQQAREAFKAVHTPLPPELVPSQLEVEGQRVMTFLSESGENLSYLERQLGQLLDPQFLAICDPVATLDYRQKIIRGTEILYGSGTAMSWSPERHRQLGLRPIFHTYDQPYGIDTHFALQSSLREIIGTEHGDGAKYEIHEMVDSMGRPVPARVLRLARYERLEHFDPEQFRGLNLFGGMLTWEQAHIRLIANGLLARIIEAELKSSGSEAFLVTWEGNKVPYGLHLSGQTIAGGQHGRIWSVYEQEIGHYQRLVEFGGDSGNVQVQLMVINRDELDWGNMLADSIDCELGHFRKEQPLEALINPEPEKEYIVKLIVKASQIKSWKFPNPAIRSRFLDLLVDRFSAALHSYSNDRIELRHPDDYALDASIFTFEHKPYRSKWR